MHGERLIQHSPMKAVAASIRGGVEPGRVGGVLGRAGTGKAALIVHVALNYLLRNTPVLHVSLADEQARVRSFYDEILAELARVAGIDDPAPIMLAVERHRVIHSCLGCSFGPEDLARLLATLEVVMHFEPAVIVVHGIDSSALDIDQWRAVASERGLRVWLAIRTHREGGPTPDQVAASLDTAIALEPQGADLTLQVLKVGGQANPEVPALHLDPVSMLVRGESVHAPVTTPPSPHPSTCTLYSTGVRGAEEVFGEVAEEWGIREVNFTFEGHDQARRRGRQLLGERELRAGAVSMVYVNNRLGRHWDKNDQLRKVLQVLWHVASSAQQLFVVGTIQDDGTVHGGTGWTVELARRWHKPVWVFDQDLKGWFNWNGRAWVEGEPVIETPRFAGTGTRFLTDAGRDAIADLFARSFGA